jgi:hypothetical protein
MRREALPEVLRTTSGFLLVLQQIFQQLFMFDFFSY